MPISSVAARVPRAFWLAILPQPAFRSSQSRRLSFTRWVSHSCRTLRRPGRASSHTPGARHPSPPSLLGLSTSNSRRLFGRRRLAAVFVRWPGRRVEMEVVLRRWKSFALLGVHFLFAISLTWLVAGSAESSREFKVDQQATLEGLRRQIESTDTSVGPQSAEQSSREASPAALERGEGASSATNVREITETVKPGDTLELILRRLGVSDGDVTYWSAASKLHPSLARLEPEHDLVFLLPRGTDRVAGLQYEMAPDAVLVMRKEGRTIAGHVERSAISAYGKDRLRRD